jgi:hypothetical protein
MGCALLRLEKKKNFIESIVSNCRKLVEVELGGGGGGVGEGIWWVGDRFCSFFFFFFGRSGETREVVWST